MFSFVTHRQAWIFSQRTAQRCKRERIQADPSTRLVAAIKDGNEPNFAIDRPTGDRELRSDLGNPGQTRQEGAAYQLFRTFILMGQVLHQRRQFLRAQGLQGDRQIRGRRRRTWRLSVRLEPGRLYQPQHDRHLQITTRLGTKRADV